MSEDAPNPELLRSLGKLTRGLSALFWGLPAWLIISAETAKADTLNPAGIIPAIVVNLLLLYGLSQLGKFQKNERPWRNALDRAKIFGLINLGLCPFLFWFSRMPLQPFFRDSIFALVLSALLFLFHLNIVLKQLGAMLPDETLRQETQQFTVLNRWLLVAWLAFVLGTTFVPQLVNFPARFSPQFLLWLQHVLTTILLCLGLSPLAITMALVWKAKEVIFNSVFGARH
ncbi:MAG: hypothetical protein ABSE48_14975 [Verrucomicrobiota bacterium]